MNSPFDEQPMPCLQGVEWLVSPCRTYQGGPEPPLPQGPSHHEETGLYAAVRPTSLAWIHFAVARAWGGVWLIAVDIWHHCAKIL